MVDGHRDKMQFASCSNCQWPTISLFDPQDDLYSTNNPFAFELDYEKLDAPALEDPLDPVIIHRDEGLAIHGSDGGRSYTIDILAHIVIKVVAASHEHPTGNHIDFKLEKLNVTGERP